MLVDAEKDFLVSQKKAKEKLAKMLDPYPTTYGNAADAIRAADLSDCGSEFKQQAHEELTAFYEEWPGGLSEVEASIAGHKRIIESLSAQVAELKKDAEQRDVVYMSCQKHMGQVWNFTVKTHIPAKIICPLCDAAKEGK